MRKVRKSCVLITVLCVVSFSIPISIFAQGEGTGAAAAIIQSTTSTQTTTAHHGTIAHH